ncbi:acetyl-CoA carboxylase biotin carboxylase subunit [Vibrio panuliri]|uniref:3-methylcrotonyl-CoA carboxylase n=1 Tax=Vibrio panuliri TaxID=1381081 RepID=A0ABX3FQX1_9VIBR|nr:acetyl/propionyl/methylcrotonyl-CoA carboxylase subunit alpha [Vibrio panuliri]KAB1457315.1 acetyl/propionyl/methylcrotonyl-CoA carboxylase subunit alpha [Vibrio panuliri]OLQ96325.1 3-methylcrotonyl-CoA carboxylase [Vibrio panuliri]
MFKRILIANRGEIACRVIRTARSMGIETVAIFSTADRHSQHSKQADIAEYVGPSPASESYLNIDKIIQIALKHRVDAIHPGYGFLSENAQFAKACSDNGIIFIGPPVQAIEQMGSKSQAKAIMAQADVPLVPGYHGNNNSLQNLLAEAEKIGYPVMLKAVMGGGGKGMRVVNNAQAMPFAIESAQREAQSSFGDQHLLIEKCIVKPRHVEIQVFADQHGHCLYLSDRDCSIQRRHQKVVEEAPAPGLSVQLRKEMGEAAVQAAKAINYVGAGTVEFLLDSSGEFYFMEMNTRLQVEHPVTELITGIDLVEWQLRVAFGEELPISQAQIAHRGHAIELRIYAEDPERDFMPSTGAITYLSEPSSIDDVRIDSGIVQGDSISEFYDPMISKLIVFGQTRSSAISQLKQALMNYHILGINTNIGYLYSIVSQPAFADLALDTDFLLTHQDSIQQQQACAPSIWLTLAALARLAVLRAQDSTLPAPTRQGFRLSQQQTSRFDFAQLRVNHHVILCHTTEDNKLTVYADEHTHEVSIIEPSPWFKVDIDGTRYEFQSRITADSTTIFQNGQQQTFSHSANHESNQTQLDELNPTAPLNGIISALLVEKGDHVEKGDPLLVLEAMKMEYTISATQGAVIDEVLCEFGDQVEHGAVLLQLSVKQDKDSTLEEKHASK